MGMGWGLGMALGNAIQKVGNIWGPERLQEQRLQNEDLRQAAQDKRQEALAKSQIETDTLARTGETAKQQFETLRRPKELEQMGVETEGARARTAQANKQIEEINQKMIENQRILDSHPLEHYRALAAQEIEKGKADIQRIKDESVASRAGAAASGTAAQLNRARLNDMQMGQDVDHYINIRRATAKDEAGFAAGYNNQFKKSLMLYKQKIDPFRLDDTSKLDDDERASYNQARAQAQILASNIADHRTQMYEDGYKNVGKQRFATPAERKAWRDREYQTTLSSLLLGDVDDDPLTGLIGAGTTSSGAVSQGASRSKAIPGED
jgi:hypothetical protein